MKKILLVEDHVLVREGLALLLKDLERNLTVLAASSCEEALRLIATHLDVELILLDLALPGMSGLEALPVFRERFPDVPVAVLSASEDRETVLETIKAGAMAFIPKSSPSPILKAALSLVASGNVYLPSTIFLDERDTSRGGETRTAGPKMATDKEEFQLTDREKAVLALLIQGRSNKSIARALPPSKGRAESPSVQTVKSHVSQILRKFGVMTRAELIVKIAEMGLTFPDR